MDNSFIFEQIEENIPAIIYKLVLKESGEFKITYISKSFYEVFQMPPDKTIDDLGELKNVLDEEDIPHLRESLQKVYSDNSIWKWVGAISINGIRKIISTQAKPDINSINEKVWIGFAFDITEQYNLQKEIEIKNKKIEAVAHNFPGIIYEWYFNKNDSSFGFSYASDKTKDILGIDPSNMMELYNMLSPRDLVRLRASSKVLLQDIRDWSFETQVKLQNGETKWVKMLATPIENNKDIVKFSGVIIDITDIKNYEIKIIERQNIILETQKMAKIGSWEFNLLEKKLIWTDEMFRIFDIKPCTDKLLTEYFKRIHPEDRDYVSTLISNPNFDEAVKTIEYKIYSKNSLKYLLATMRAVKDNEGKAYKFWGTAQDITELKNKEFELIKTKNEAEKANKAKSDFLSNMSHELRTPINAVIGITNLLLQGDPKPEQIDNLNMLKFSSKNLLVLVNDILDFSKIEAGKIDFEQTPFSIRNILNNIKSVFSTIISEKDLILSLNIANDIPEYLIGDPARLSQIINNLMSNSVKFTEKGIIEINIFLKEVKNDIYTLIFFISDTGIGIPEEKLEHIFESFTQASSETNRKFGGTGLGLAITKRLIELQGSKLNVKSKVGKGSVFSFILDFKKSDSLAESIKSKIEMKSLKGLKILLVEDNKINMAIALQFLKKWDINVDTAINGFEAVEKVKNNIYALVLMDLQMPEMDGYEATKNIRQMENEYFKNLPIIALTASATTDIIQRCKEVGINDFISKPFEPNDLYQKLSNYQKK